MPDAGRTTRGGPGRFFVNHPGLYGMSVAAAAGTAMYAAVRSAREVGRRRLPWVALAVVEAGISAGMVHSRGVSARTRSIDDGTPQVWRSRPSWKA